MRKVLQGFLRVLKQERKNREWIRLLREVLAILMLLLISHEPNREVHRLVRPM